MNLPTINALDFNTPTELAVALIQRKIEVPCRLRVGQEGWTVHDYEHASRLAHGIMLATAEGWTSTKL